MATDVLLIDGRTPAKCELCGAIGELRPYGPNGENICFDCGMKNEPETARQKDKLWVGKKVVIIK